MPKEPFIWEILFCVFQSVLFRSTNISSPPSDHQAQLTCISEGAKVNSIWEIFPPGRQMGLKVTIERTILDPSSTIRHVVLEWYICAKSEQGQKRGQRGGHQPRLAGTHEHESVDVIDLPLATTGQADG